MPILSSSIVILFLAFLVSFPHISNASLPDACKAAAASSPNVNYNLCLTSLQADPKSTLANPTELAKIATNLASENAKTTKAKIKNLLADTANVAMNPELSTCRSLYSSMIDNLSVAAKAIDSSQKGTARTYLSAALDKPGNCEGAFSDKQSTSVLSKENTNAKQLAAIALALLNM